MQIVINISRSLYDRLIDMDIDSDTCSFNESALVESIQNGTPLPKGHGKLKDEDEIVKAIEDRVEFLRKNDATFRRLHKDIDILGCIPKIRCEVPTIIEADKCEDCRNCKKWNECSCGKEGHENKTSTGYSIGECNNYDPCEDCISRHI